MSTKMLLKRKREETEQGGAPQKGMSPGEVIRSDIWYEDGNLILQAGSTQFCVHRGVISKYSAVFRETLRENNLQDSACPVVEVSDTPQDMHYLLEALYEWNFRLYKRLPLQLVVSLIRLSHKYRVPKISEELVSRLRDEWPSDYETWISRTRPEIRSIEAEHDRAVILEMLRLTRTCHLTSLLPGLYLNVYSLFSLDELETNLSSEGQDLEIPDEERMKLLAGLVRLRYHNSTKGWVSINKLPLPGCRSAQTHACFKTKVEMYEKEFLSHDSLQGSRPNLSPMDPTLTAKLCGVCSKVIQEHNAARKELWANLPSFFKLPGWDALTTGA